MSRVLPWLLVALLFASSGLVSGCAPVQAWERDILARRDMAFEPDELDAAIRSHVHFSKEAGLKGGAAGGGGCGCN